MKSYVQAMLSKALDTLVSRGVLQSIPTDESIQVERTRDPTHGDFASNCAMVLCKSAGLRPRDLAQQIVDALQGSHLVQEVTIAGPGFINFRFSASAWQAEIRRVLEEGPRYGTSQLGMGKR
ncbi:MAG: arginine--tRNA ligase, partial [Gammaproteobacteria bacterium]|nr:arginine--tRNA ligase [Gammaproteobacteria bacterium]